MPYGTLKADTLIFTNGGIDKSVTVSGIFESISGNLTVTGTISGDVIRGGTTVSGATITGAIGQFSNLTAVSGVFTTISGGTYTLTSGVFASGTAANPSISFVSDPNTGIYSPGADQVAISTSGAGRVFVNNTGLGVGISAGRSIDVYKSDAAGRAILRLSDVDSRNVELRSPDGLGNTAGVGSVTNHDFTFFINNTERARLDTSGNLGLGTSAPNYQLHVTTSFAVGASGFNQQLSFTNDTIQSLLLGTGYTALKLNPLGGNVGINTSSPGALLDVYGSGNIVRFGDGTNTFDVRFKGPNNWAVQLDTSADKFNIQRNSSPLVTVDSSGRVGIGTTSPSAPLHLSTGATAASALFASTDTTAYSATSFLSGARLRITGGSATSAYNGITFGNNSNAEGFIGFVQNSSGYNDFVIQSYAGSYSEKLRVTSAGNVGIGTTSPAQALSVVGNIIADGSAASQYVASSKAGVTSTYLMTDANGGNIQTDGAWPIRFTINSTERARIDSSGRLLVGTSTSPSSGDSQYARVRIQGNTLNNAGFFAIARNEAASALTAGSELGQVFFTDNAGNGFATIKCEADATAGTNDYPGRLVFSTTADGASSPTERMRITSGGYIKASNTGSYTDAGGGSRATNAQHFFRSDQNGLTIQATNTNINTAVEGFTSDFATGATGNHFIGAINLGRVFIVAANGNVTNTNNSYGAISDVKLKANIVDANSQWDDLKALQVRNYNLKEGQTHTQIGLIAQEAELVSPGLVSESPDLDAEGNELGTVTKSVNYSVLYMKAIKALQEAMERIETLEASNAAMEARLSALENG